MALKTKHPISVSGGSLIHKDQEVVVDDGKKSDPKDTRPRLKKDHVIALLEEGALIDDAPKEAPKAVEPPKA